MSAAAPNAASRTQTVVSRPSLSGNQKGMRNSRVGAVAAWLRETYRPVIEQVADHTGRDIANSSQPGGPVTLLPRTSATPKADRNGKLEDESSLKRSRRPGREGQKDVRHIPPENRC
jgi:hypothetical protein